MKRTIALALALVGLASARGDSWELAYRDGELDVSRDASQPHPTYKGEGTVEAGFFDLLAVISDVSRRTEWVRDLRETRIVEGDVESKVVIYEKFHLPWPCRDRDSVVESTIRPDPARLEVSVDYHEVTRSDVPEREGVVRMPYVRGRMFFRAIDEGHTFARFVISLDVGGSIPGFLVNQTVRRAPVETVRGLLRQVKQTKGKYESFIRAHRGKTR